MRALGRILALLGPFRWRIGLAVVLGALTVGGGVGLMGTAAFLIAAAALQPSIAELQVAIVGVRFFGITRGVFRYLERLVAHRVTLDLLGRLRRWFIEALEPLAPARTVELASADLHRRVVGDVESLQELFVRAVAPSVVAVVVGAAVAWLLGGLDRGLAMAFAVAFAGTAVVVTGGVSVLAAPRRGELVAARQALTSAVADALQGMPELLAFGREGVVADRVRRCSEAAERARSRAARREALGDAGVVAGTHAAVWLVLVLAIPMIGEGTITGVHLAVVCLVVMAAFEAVQPLPAAASSLGEQHAAAERVLAVLDAPAAVVDGAAGEMASEPDPSRPVLELRDVAFAHPGGSGHALDGVDLTVEHGARVAIVGPSGAGKSTLAHLLLRFWDPSSGEIALGGRPLRSWPLERLRSVVGLLPQRVDLFTGSIRDNLLLAAPRATGEQLDAAADRAGLLETVRALPDGWETWIGEQGMRLSGGQRQRLAIARLVLRDPRVVVLDEPSAGLDPATERRVVESLLGLFAGRALVVITHRLAAMELFDEIVVLDRGRIIERGSHHELLAGRGLYARLLRAEVSVWGRPHHS
ncbi:MAG: thiol reductant ABC exporter subunit CydC [Thermoanaerobaculales bacterium]|nr:thiol reductant ABC exporter subunit CydC [Thermoanaerobaculales bacterium]